MKYNILRKIIFICLSICLGIIIFNQLSYLMEEKYSRVKYKDFFSQEEDFDVLFVGSSHIVNGILPMDIWGEHGLVSYNLGGHGNTIPISYWVLKNALDYTTPKVVVIDGYLIESEYKIGAENYSSMHKSFDAFPLSITKINSIFDLLNDDKIEDEIAKGNVIVNEKRTPIGLLWNYSVYHNRWNELTKEDFKPLVDYNKGAGEFVDLSKVTLVPSNEITDLNEIDNIGVRYLNKIIELCNSKGIKILLVYLPSTNEHQAIANGYEKYAESINVDCINFMKNNIINSQTDYADSRGHLNPSGARKVSLYISKYLQENYGIEDRRNDDLYSEWNNDYEEYIDYKIWLLKEQEKIENLFILLNDSSFCSNIVCTESFYSKNRLEIDNIKTLGECSIEIKETDKLYTTEKKVDAIIEVNYENHIINKFYCIGNNIYSFD